jgi:hypothetical protein
MKTIFFLLAVLCGASLMAQQTNLSEKEANDIAVDAYIYAYPLITMDLTKKVMTNVVKPEDSHAPVGQFANIRSYPNASFREITAPNADTLYSTAWLDLSKEPYILHVPDEHGRYYLMPMLNGWTDVFADPGARTTGTDAADFAITGPHWKGTLPKNVKEFKSPTNMVWIIGRTYSTGTPEDYQAVHVIQDQYSLTPLSTYGKPYTPPEGTFDSTIDMKTPVRNQVNQMGIQDYFNRLASLLKDNPPAAEDAVIVAKMAKIGLVPGQPFDINKLSSKIVNALQSVPQVAQQKIMDEEKSAGLMVRGWVYSLKTGVYDSNYLQRAFITAIGLGANRPQDAIYPYTTVDAEGQTLNGKNNYVIHFPKGQIPPVKGFWSLTMYNDQYFFVDNPLNRYTLSPRNALKYNEDGSLDLYIQNTSPSKDKESNWLPAPTENFILMLRLYWPEEALLNGSWTPPAVQKQIFGQQKKRKPSSSALN